MLTGKMAGRLGVIRSLRKIIPERLKPGKCIVTAQSLRPLLLPLWGHPGYCITLLLHGDRMEVGAAGLRRQPTQVILLRWKPEQATIITTMCALAAGNITMAGGLERAILGQEAAEAAFQNPLGMNTIRQLLTVVL